VVWKPYLGIIEDKAEGSCDVLSGPKAVAESLTPQSNSASGRRSRFLSFAGGARLEGMLDETISGP